jgi:hypothetical protein
LSPGFSNECNNHPSLLDEWGVSNDGLGFAKGILKGMGDLFSVVSPEASGLTNPFTRCQMSGRRGTQTQDEQRRSSRPTPT